MQTKKRIVLWKKQRQFLDACLAGSSTVADITKKHGISNKMLMQWMDKPIFNKQYEKVKRFQQRRSDMDLAISRTRSAERLNRMMQSNATDEKHDAIAVKLVGGKSPRKKTRKPTTAVRRLAHPDHSDEERMKLLDALHRKAASAK